MYIYIHTHETPNSSRSVLLSKAVHIRKLKQRKINFTRNPVSPDNRRQPVRLPFMDRKNSRYLPFLRQPGAHIPSLETLLLSVKKTSLSLLSFDSWASFLHLGK